MNLIKRNWTKTDAKEFVSYLNSIAETDKKKINWTKRIYNTNLSVLAIKIPTIKKIAKEINKGNPLSFLSLNLHSNFETYLICGCLITKIDDFDCMKTYLNKYSQIIDSWALCDCLDFNIKNENEDKYFNLSLDYINSIHPFCRRIGLLVWFKFIERANYLKIIIDNLSKFKKESHYYVNMALAWLIAELFVKNRNICLSLFENKILNPFVNNKAIQKIKDSFRVSLEDKKFLEKFKIKNNKSLRSKTKI